MIPLKTVERLLIMSMLDIAVFVISVIGIFLEMLQKPLFWLMYIIASVLLGYEFIDTKLYGSALLQVIYVVLSIYGWYKWTHRDAKQKLETICHTQAMQWLHYTIATCIIGLICYYILKYTGDSDYLVDAILTAICITATYMAALKQIESWFVFAATVVISVPLYYRDHLYFTSLTYLIFGILDLSGGVKWLLDYKSLVKNLKVKRP